MKLDRKENDILACVNDILANPFCGMAKKQKIMSHFLVTARIGDRKPANFCAWDRRK